MKVNEIAECCGGKILNSFGNTIVAVDQFNYSIASIKKFIIQQETFHKNMGLSFLMIILNEQQLKKIKPILDELKWELVMDNAFHPNHMTKISMFIKKLNEDHYLNRI